MARMLAPINTVKHYVHFTNSTVASGAGRAMVHVDAAVAPATGTAADVKEGAIIKAVYVEQWIKSNATAGNDTQFMLLIEKVPINAAAIGAAQLLNVGAYTNKKNVLYFTQGVIGDLTTQALPVHRGWVKIPKSKQRFGLSDRLVVTVGSVGTGIQSCGFSTYKEYI